MITDKLEQSAERMLPERLSLIATILVFMVARGFFWLLGWLSSVMAFLIFHLLLATKFAKIYVELKNREAVVLK